MELKNIILPGHEASARFDVQITEGTIRSITHSADRETPPSLLLPTLCHPHIHLDKAFILNSHSTGPDFPDYSDLVPETGEFKEALERTAKAKSRYTRADLLRRGSQLIAESVQAGVTSMRAFVEVDNVTKFKCVEAAIELKSHFSNVCHIQICVFAQDPVFSTQNGDENRRLMEEALSIFRDHIDVIGSTPYVEQDVECQARNIEWAVQQALKENLHLDFHLDYNLDPQMKPMVWKVVEEVKQQDWPSKLRDRTVVAGHCTRMTLFSQAEMETLASEICTAKLPISFVGLPTSDIFMMGRPSSSSDWGGSRPRGTLQTLQMMNRFGLNACLGINNVGNAFTPWGSLDPLRLASFGVGLYQASTPKDAQMLFESVSSRAREAIGLKGKDEESIASRFENGTKGPFLLIRNAKSIEARNLPFTVPARSRLDIKDVIWDPPDINTREIISN